MRIKTFQMKEGEQQLKEGKQEQVKELQLHSDDTGGATKAWCHT